MSPSLLSPRHVAISGAAAAAAYSSFDPVEEQPEAETSPPPTKRLSSSRRRSHNKSLSPHNTASNQISSPAAPVLPHLPRKATKSLHRLFTTIIHHPPSASCTAAAFSDLSASCTAASLSGAAKDGDGGGVEWRKLGVGPSELCLPLTLLTGQSFRWRQTAPDQFTGVLGCHLLSLKQTPDSIFFHLHNPPSPSPSCSGVDAATEALHDYFNLGTSLASLYERFCEADARFAAVAPFVGGARLLRQAPVECVFQFICSSNNHIRRISDMVDHLCAFGPLLGSRGGHQFHAFPSLDQLAEVTEKQLREAGFGYRAKYIVGTVQELSKKDGGGANWLNSLKNQPLDQAVEALCTLPGIGPKVAACIALFSLDKHDAIPVDTHVWQIAVRYLTPELAGKRPTPTLHSTVARAFVSKFGQYAGWAQLVLFISELAAYQNLLPLHLQSPKSIKLSRN